MKDRQLKDLLTEHKLSTSGDRNSWIARHQRYAVGLNWYDEVNLFIHFLWNGRWVMIYNANLDKSESQRKTIQELRSDLKKWEEDRKTKKNIVGDVDAYQVCPLYVYTFARTDGICFVDRW
jgi:E3 ubiquitin-protein ligase RAD18